MEACKQTLSQYQSTLVDRGICLLSADATDFQKQFSNEELKYKLLPRVV